jgi:hypothetical protein
MSDHPNTPRVSDAGRGVAFQRARQIHATFSVQSHPCVWACNILQNCFWALLQIYNSTRVPHGEKCTQAAGKVIVPCTFMQQQD